MEEEGQPKQLLRILPSQIPNPELKSHDRFSSADGGIIVIIGYQVGSPCRCLRCL